MSKGLEALRRIGKIHIVRGNRIFDEYLIREQLQDYSIIEKELKAFDVIKNKSVDISTFGAFETYEDYEHFYNMKFHLIENEMDKLDEEEFNLLKEVLEECG